MVPEMFCDLARRPERPCFDWILIGDSSHVGDAYGGSREICLKRGLAVPRQAPAITAP
ncbi:hypothetical protein GCM10011504_23760 [Siccirubricoccus deserti]|nr:hypothetical protein GCM10011504_23760 [Siccirubricoccus deserti]